MDECSVHVANVLSEVATRSSLLPHDLLPISITYGKKALTYLKRLIHGPRGGLRVQQLLLTWCDTKVISWGKDKVRLTRDGIIKEKAKQGRGVGARGMYRERMLTKKSTY